MFFSPTLRTGFLLITLAFLSLYFLHDTQLLPSATNGKLKFQITTKGAVGVLKSWYGLPVGELENAAGDDIGPVYLLAAFLYKDYSREDILDSKTIFIPKSFYFLMSLGFWLSACLLFFAGYHLVGPIWALVFSSFLLFSGTGNFLSFSGMTYIFPVLSASVLLAWIVAIKEYPGRWLLSSITAFLTILYSDFMRNSSPLLLLVPLIMLVQPGTLFPNLEKTLLRVMRKSAGAFLGIWIAFQLINPLPTGHSSSFWNAIYLGLYEYGGCVDVPNKSVYPKFAKNENMSNNLWYSQKWADFFFFTEILKVDPNYKKYNDYKPEYEKIFFEKIKYYFTKYPQDIAKIFFLRIWRVTLVNPWQRLNHDSEILFLEPLDTFLRILWIAPILVALWFGVFKEPFFRIVLCMLPLVAYVLLVHSGYMIYSYPIHFVGYLLWLVSIKRLVEFIRDRFTASE